MRKYRKIYGVHGMMEYQAIIRVGGGSMLVSFTEGSSTAMGVTPATFSTDNLMYQHAIEHSDDFRSGRIRLLKSLPLDGEVEVGRNRSKCAPAADACACSSDAAGGACECVSEDAGCQRADAPSDVAPPSGGMVRKEFACRDDARDWLESEFGMRRTSSSLRSRAGIVAAGAERGVEIVFED